MSMSETGWLGWVDTRATADNMVKASNRVRGMGRGTRFSDWRQLNLRIFNGFDFKRNAQYYSNCYSLPLS